MLLGSSLGSDCLTVGLQQVESLLTLLGEVLLVLNQLSEVNHGLVNQHAGDAPSEGSTEGSFNDGVDGVSNHLLSGLGHLDGLELGKWNTWEGKQGDGRGVGLRCGLLLGVVVLLLATLILLTTFSAASTEATTAATVAAATTEVSVLLRTTLATSWLILLLLLLAALVLLTTIVSLLVHVWWDKSLEE